MILAAIRREISMGHVFAYAMFTLSHSPSFEVAPIIPTWELPKRGRIDVTTTNARQHLVSCFTCMLLECSFSPAARLPPERLLDLR